MQFLSGYFGSEQPGQTSGLSPTLGALKGAIHDPYLDYLGKGACSLSWEWLELNPDELCCQGRQESYMNAKT